MLEKIHKLIKQENKKIVFYFDEDNSKQEELLSLKDSDVKVVEVKHNFFELKYKIEFEWRNKFLFLYHPYPKPKGEELKKYPLLDLLIANVELRLDDASEFITEYRLSNSNLSLVKQYINQLKTKTNQKKLAKILVPESFSESNLKQGLISIALGFNTVVDRNTNIAKFLTLASDEKVFSKAINNLNQQSLEEDLLKWINFLVDTKHTELNLETATETACKVKYNILTAFVDNIQTNDSYKKIKLPRSADINKLQAFFADWTDNQGINNRIDDVFTVLASDIKSENILKWYGTQQELGYYSSGTIEIIIKELLDDINQNSLKAKEDCIKWRQSSILNIQQSLQVDFIYYTANVFTILDSYSSYVFNTPDEYIKNYTDELYKVDLNYRKAVSSLETVRDELNDLEKTALALFEKLNKRYDRFLIELNVNWQTILNEINFDYSKINVSKQYEFYKENISDTDNKMVVIISDALRYELAYELYDDLMSDSKNKLSISPSLASIPSYTNLGMSNLLPHNGITVNKGESDLVFKIDGKTTVSGNRELILRKEESSSSTIDFSDIMKLDRESGRSFFKENRIVYIYHDWIDAIGDKRGTEHETFQATSKAKNDLKRLMSKLYGWNVYNITITSDHGFLFNYNEMPEASRETFPATKGYARTHTRFVVADEFESKSEGYQMQMRNTTNLDTDLMVSIPRAVNRYRKQGNIGLKFVHGGASLQELITPVLKFYKDRRDNFNEVTFKRIDGNNKISSGNIKISLLQEQAVSNNFKSTNIIFALYNDRSELLSNEEEVYFNSTSDNPRERFTEVLLTLNAEGTKANYCFLKAFSKKDRNKLNPIKVSDSIKINSLMEKDEF